MPGYQNPYRQPYNGFGGIEALTFGHVLITVPAGAGFGDADTITINGEVYEADTAGDGVVPGNVDVDIAVGDTAGQVRTKLIAAIVDPLVTVTPIGANQIDVRMKEAGVDIAVSNSVGAEWEGAWIEYPAGVGTGLMPAIIGELRAVRPDPFWIDPRLG
jgi:hypothetical protein